MNQKSMLQCKRRLCRRRLTPAQSLTEKWQVPDVSQMSEKEIKRYNRFKDALKDYIAGKNTRLIKSLYGVSLTQLQEQIWRATQVDEDGEPYGFRALVKHIRIKSQTRNKILPSHDKPTGPECTGSFKALLTKENLQDWLESRILKTDPEPHESKITVVGLQKDLCTILTERGYKATEYPFNTSRPMYTSLSREIKRIKQKNFELGIGVDGNLTAITNINVMSGKSKPLQNLKPLDEVECDEHKLHCIAGVKITIDGIEKIIPTPRIVGIAIVDRKTGVPLGAAIHLGIEAKEVAIIAAIRSAVVPNSPVLLPNGETAPPFRACDFLPELKGAIWTTMYLDNAKIHVGDAYFQTEKRMGTQTCWGPSRSWSARPHIESLFGNLVNAYFSGTPSFTGAGKAYEGRDAPAEQAAKWNIDLSDVCRLFYEALAAVALAKSSGTLYEGRIDVIRNYLSSTERPILRELPPPTANTPEVGTLVERVRVKRRGADNANLYINRNGKYTNLNLSHRGDLYNEEIIIHVSENVRTILAFQKNGKPLGELVADGVWGKFDHNSELRQAIEKDKDKTFGQHGEPITAVRNFLTKLGKRTAEIAARRKTGEVVNEGLKLARYMEAAKVTDINIDTSNSKNSIQPQPLSTVNSALERARRAKKALKNQRRNRDE